MRSKKRTANRAVFNLISLSLKFSIVNRISGRFCAYLNNFVAENLKFYTFSCGQSRPAGGRRGFTRIECVGRYPAPGGSFLPSKNTVGWDRGHIHCYYSFLDCIAHGKEPSPSLAEGVALQRLMEQAKTSAREKRWINCKAGMEDA